MFKRAALSGMLAAQIGIVGVPVTANAVEKFKAIGESMAGDTTLVRQKPISEEKQQKLAETLFKDFEDLSSSKIADYTAFIKAYKIRDKDQFMAALGDVSNLDNIGELARAKPSEPKAKEKKESAKSETVAKQKAKAETKEIAVEAKAEAKPALEKEKSKEAANVPVEEGNISNLFKLFDSEISELSNYSRSSKYGKDAIAAYCEETSAQLDSMKKDFSSGKITRDDVIKFRSNMLTKDDFAVFSKMMDSYNLFMKTSDVKLLEAYMKIRSLYPYSYSDYSTSREAKAYFDYVKSFLADKKLPEKFGEFTSSSTFNESSASYAKVKTVKEDIIRSISASYATESSFSNALERYSAVYGKDYSFLGKWMDLETAYDALKIEGNPEAMGSWISSNFRTVAGYKAAFNSLKERYLAFYKNMPSALKKGYDTSVSRLESETSMQYDAYSKGIDANPQYLDYSNNIQNDPAYMQYAQNVDSLIDLTLPFDEIQMQRAALLDAKKTELLASKKTELLDSEKARLDSELKAGKATSLSDYESGLSTLTGIKATKGEEIDNVLNNMSVVDLYLFKKAVDLLDRNNFNDQLTYNGFIENMITLSSKDPYLLTSYLAYVVPGLISTAAGNEKGMLPLFASFNANVDRELSNNTADFQKRENLRMQFRIIRSDLPAMVNEHSHQDLFYDIWEKRTGFEGTGYYGVKPSRLLSLDNYFMIPSFYAPQETYNLSPALVNSRYADKRLAFSMPDVYPGALSYNYRLDALLHPTNPLFRPQIPNVSRIERFNENSAIFAMNSIMARRLVESEYSSDMVQSLVEFASAAGDKYFGIGGRGRWLNAAGGSAMLEATGEQLDSTTRVYHDLEASRVVMIKDIHSATVKGTANYDKATETGYIDEVAKVFVPVAKQKGDMLVYLDGNWGLGNDKRSDAKEGWYLVTQTGNTYRMDFRQNNEYDLFNYVFGEANAKKWLASTKGYTYDRVYNFQGAAIGFTARQVAAAGLANRLNYIGTDGNEHAISMSKSDISGPNDVVIATYRGLYSRENEKFNVELKYKNVPPNVKEPAFEVSALGGTFTGGLQIKTENAIWNGLGGTVVYSGINPGEIYGMQQSMSNFLTNVYGWKKDDARNLGAYASATYMYSQVRDQAETTEGNYGMGMLILWLDKFNMLAAGEKAPPWLSEIRQIGNLLENNEMSREDAVSQMNRIMGSKDVQRYALGMGVDNKVYLVASTDLERYANMRGFLFFTDKNEVVKGWLESLAYGYYTSTSDTYADLGVGGGATNVFRVLTGPTIALNNISTEGVVGWSGQALAKVINSEKAKGLKSDIILGASGGYKRLSDADLSEVQITISGAHKNLANAPIEESASAWYAFYDRKENRIRLTSDPQAEKDWSVTTGYEFRGRFDMAKRGTSVDLHFTYGQYMDTQPYLGGGVTYTSYGKLDEWGFGVKGGVGPLEFYPSNMWSWNYLGYGRLGEKDWGVRTYFFYRF